MKTAVLLIFICFFASWSLADEPEEKKQGTEKKPTRLLQSISPDSLDLTLERNKAQVQEEVSVEAPDYPGLEVSVQSPAKSLTTYKPYTKKELQAYSDALIDNNLSDYDRTETARPHKKGRIFRVSVPD